MEALIENRAARITLACFTLVAIGYVDFRESASFVFFYFLIVILSAYYIGGSASTAITMVVSIVRFLTSHREILTLDFSSQNLVVHAWDFTNILLTYMTINFLINRQNEILEIVKTSARIDVMTGLPNRRAFQERVSEWFAYTRRHKTSMSLAYIDVDGFKKVNDTRGHQYGDDLLRLIGKTILTCLRQEDHVSRLGGDEFAVLSLNPKNIIASTERIKQALDMACNQFGVSFSVGVITYISTNDNITINEQDLVRMADNLMYEVKKSTKNSIKYQTIE